MEKTVDIHKNEAIPQPPADYLDHDPRFRELLQEASKDSMRSDTSGYMGRHGYSWNEKGNIIDSEGQETSPVNLIGPAQIESVTDAAKREFSDRYQKDFGVYEGREKVRVYGSPSSDPAYVEAERQIMRITNQKNDLSEGHLDSLGDRRRLRDREQELVNIAHWGKFVSEYPEKASAYTSQNEYIAKAIAEEEKRKQYWEDVKNKQKEKDETRRQEIRHSLNGGGTQTENAPVIDQTQESEPGGVPDVREFGDNKSITRGGEEIFKNPWNDDPELKALQVNIENETQKRMSANPGVHENFADQYSAVANEVRSELWKAFIAKYPEKAKAYEEHYKEIRDILEPTEPVLSKEDVISYFLAYQDISASADEKKSMLEFSMKNESAGRYAEALQDILEHNPRQQIEGIASHMVSEATDILGRFDIPKSQYLGSKTWAMWDIGKQYYYATHPDEADPKYVIADPLKSPEKVQEMIDRQVGWEAYRAKDSKFAEKYKKHPLYKKLQEYLGMKSKNRDTLSSKDLAELGALVRKISESKN